MITSKICAHPSHRKRTPRETIAEDFYPSNLWRSRAHVESLRTHSFPSMVCDFSRTFSLQENQGCLFDVNEASSHPLSEQNALSIDRNRFLWKQRKGHSKIFEFMVVIDGRALSNGNSSKKNIFKADFHENSPWKIWISFFYNLEIRIIRRHLFIRNVCFSILISLWI